MSNSRQELAGKIYQAIKDTSLLCGDKLPPEREIAAIFKVSRTSAREALIVLETLGFIEVRGKEGICLRKLSDAEFNRSLDVYATWPAEMLPQTFQVRILLESEAAGLAAMHHTDEDMQRLDYCVQGFAGIYHNKPDDWNVQGSALNDLFHKLIIEASHNEVLLRIHEGLLRTIKRAYASFGLDAMITPLEQWDDNVIKGHRNILEAIGAHDEHKARAFMRDHLAITLNKQDTLYKKRVETALHRVGG